MRWNVEEHSLIIDFAQFLREEIFPTLGIPNVEDLLTYELAFFFVNEKIRGEYYLETCVHVPDAYMDENPVANSYGGLSVTLGSDAAEIMQGYVSGPCVYRIYATDYNTVAVEAKASGKTETKTFPVFRQIEY